MSQGGPFFDAQGNEVIIVAAGVGLPIMVLVALFYLANKLFGALWPLIPICTVGIFVFTVACFTVWWLISMYNALEERDVVKLVLLCVPAAILTTAFGCLVLYLIINYM